MSRKARTDIPWSELRSLTAARGATPRSLDTCDRFISRRRFLGQSGAAAAMLGFGAEAALAGLFGRGLIPAAWAEEAEPQVPGRPGMIVHSTRPINGEFPPHLLDDDVTPPARHFVRNNGPVPARALARDPRGWTLTVDGEVNQPLSLTLEDLRAMPSVTLPLLIECGGNGRAHFDPQVRGNPWDRGAVGCSAWTGVRLRDVLERAGLKPSAVYTAHYGEDARLGAEPFSRGIPLDKAMEEHTLIAYRMNGQDLEPLNGYPVRLVVPGWIGSCSQKWLTRIWVRDRVHDAAKMNAYAYRIPAYPVVPGTRPAASDMVVATSWVVKSMITRPQAGVRMAPYDVVMVRGHAWAGERNVRRVLVSADYAVSWKEAELQAPPNKYAWYTFATELGLPGRGYYEIWARAFDDAGDAQPFRQPWNPRGYLGNVIHRVPIHVGV